jgi:hypothetical protein
MGIREIQQKLDALRVAMDASNADLHKCSALLVELKVCTLLNKSRPSRGPISMSSIFKAVCLWRSSRDDLV